jgi:hypothetical protein
MPIITIDRIFQWDCMVRDYVVYCDGEKIGKINAGESEFFELSPGFHKLRIVVLPYFTRHFEYNFNEGEAVELTTGFSYKNFLHGLSPYALKLLPKNEFEKLNYEEYPQEFQNNKKVAFACTAAAIMVLAFTLFSGFIKKEANDFIFLLALSQLVGGILLFNKNEISGRNYFLSRAFLDAIFLLMVAFASVNLGATVMLVTMAAVLFFVGFFTFLSNRRQNSTFIKDAKGIIYYSVFGLLMFLIIASSFS